MPAPGPRRFQPSSEGTGPSPGLFGAGSTGRLRGLPRYTWKDRLRYRFDSFMSKGGSSVFISLLVLFISAWLVLGCLRLLLASVQPTGSEDPDTVRNVWYTFLQLTAPSNMKVDNRSAFAFKIVAMAAGLTGVVIFSMLIAFITTALSRKLATLRKGHSAVIERGHTLVLGWNDRLLEIVRALVIAKESEPGGAIVVLADRDKEEMDDFLDNHLKDTQRRGTRVVTRRGATSSLVNLAKVASGEAASVIVLADCGDHATAGRKLASDTRVVKTVLALLAARPAGKRYRVVAELYTERKRHLVKQLAPEEITTFDSDDILAKILVQTSRSSGLSVVYNELFSFDGCELYFHRGDWPEQPFGTFQLHFDDGIPIGVVKGDLGLIINPPPDLPVVAGERLVLMARDNSSLRYHPSPLATPRPLTLHGGRLQPVVERNLILGWNQKAPTIIREYEDYVLEGSSIRVVLRRATTSIRAEIEALQQELTRVELSLQVDDPLEVDTLVALEPFTFNNIIILSQDGVASDPEKTDTDTILILLLLRTMFEQHEQTNRYTKLITEVLDSGNKELVSKAGVNDFIISNRFVSMIIAQYSEEPEIQRVYGNLFREAGSEIYLKPVALYLGELPTEVSFADLLGLVQKRDEICLGVKLQDAESDPRRNWGVELNPPKTRRYTLRPGDSLVVLAEDDT